MPWRMALNAFISYAASKSRERQSIEILQAYKLHRFDLIHRHKMMAIRYDEGFKRVVLVPVFDCSYCEVEVASKV